MTNPINEGIKRLRAQHKLTQTELANMADIPRATLANMESDKSNPSIGVVVKVAQALTITTREALLVPMQEQVEQEQVTIINMAQQVLH